MKGSLGLLGCFVAKRNVAALMSFGGFLDNNSGGGGSGGLRNGAEIQYSNGATTNNHNSSNNNNNNDRTMPSGAISQPRLVTSALAKSMFNSPGLSLALVRERSSCFVIVIISSFPRLLLTSF